MSQKNAVIELLRFVYASCIIFFHVSRFDLHTAMDTIVTLGPWNVCLFRMGNLSVEFFFVVSGYLMASSVYRVISSGQKSDVSIGEETCSYLFRKVRSIYPYYALAFSYIAVVVLLIDRDISYILKCLPSLIFLQRTGISEESFVSLAWYVSSMLMAMAVIYPLLKKYYYTFTTLIAPFGGLLLIGILIRMTGNLLGTLDWFGFTYKCNLRALAEIALGTCCFEISRRLQQISLSTVTRVILSLTAILCIPLSIAYMCSDSLEYNGQYLLMIMYMVTVIFSRAGILGSSDLLYRSRVFIYLGSLSVPMFFFQNIFRNLRTLLFKDMSNTAVFLFVYLDTILLSVVINLLIKRPGQAKPR